MCGLVGIAGDLRFADEFTMKRLLLADYFRGPDSTGLAAIRTGGDAFISKLNSNPIDLFGMESFKKALNGNLSRIFMGHNRLATKGGITTVNAHPFEFGHIVGAHNGTLTKATIDLLHEKLGEEFSVDSMALFAAIAKFGIEKTIKMCEEGKTSGEGAWALVWFNREEGTLNFLRNKHRSLYYAYEGPPEDKPDDIAFKRMFWASEFWMMREALASSAPGYRVYTKPDTNIGYFSFDEDVHFKYDLASLCAGGKEPPKPKAKKLKGKEVEVKTVVPFQQRVSGQGTASGWPRPTDGTPSGSATNPKSRNTSTTPLTTRRGTNERRSILQLNGSSIRPYANIITEENFNKNYSGKCFWCSKPIVYGDYGVTFFERDKNMLCRCCSGYPDDMEKPSPRVYVTGSVMDALC